MEVVGTMRQVVDDAGRLHLAAIAARKTDGYDSHLLGLGEGSDEIGRIAAGRDADQTVAGLALRDDLAHEDVLEADVVADRRDHREIGDKVDRGERRAAGGDRMDEFDGDVRRVAARAAVAHGEQAAAAAIDIGDGLGRGDERRRLLAEEARIGLARVRAPSPRPNEAARRRASPGPAACRAGMGTVPSGRFPSS